MTWAKCRKSGTKILVLLLVLICAEGCTTSHPLTLSEKGFTESIKQGDKVKVQTADGRVIKFKVDSVSHDEISGDEQMVGSADVVTIERREISIWKSCLLAAGVVVLLGALTMRVDYPRSDPFAY
jgi:hypothetical protein